MVDDVDALRAFVRQRIPVCPDVDVEDRDDRLEVEGYPFENLTGTSDRA